MIAVILEYTQAGLKCHRMQGNAVLPHPIRAEGVPPPQFS